MDWYKIARLVLLSRRLDELEETQLAPQGKIKYQFSAGGHELAQVLLALTLDHQHDAATVYYRSRPFALASGLSVAEALASGMASSGGLTEGRDTGVMYNLPRRSGATILPSSGNVGAQYTPAAGWAQAILYRQRVLQEDDWQGAIAVALGGDGSIASNGFWAALNIATTLNLPMLFFLEDNAFGLSVPSSLQTPDGDIAANLSSFKNLKILSGDGSEPVGASQLVWEAVRHVRSGSGPSLLRLHVPRLSGHTFIDDQSYKSPAIRLEEASRDPLPRLRSFMHSQGMSQEDWATLNEQVGELLANALREAEALPEPDPSQALSHRFYQGISPLVGGLRPESILPSLGSSETDLKGPRINMVDAIRQTLEVELHLNPHMLVFGEDVGVKGGVHGATMDLQAHFGALRVFDTSLNEDGIIGRSIGMALAGLLPVPEIQFRKYADPAHEQISDLGTLRWRTAGKFAAPVVVRIPVGFGKKTGDPWHSVSAEAIYAHLPGWRLAYPANAADAVGLLRAALRGDDPTMFFEHRALLDTSEGRRPYPGDDYCLPFGKAAQLAEGNELTLVTWGAMISRCLEAIHTFPGKVSLLDLRTIIPWDQQAVLESVQNTGKILVVHEDTYTNGFAGEIIATIAEQAFTYLDAPIGRLTTADIPIPYNINLMNSILPGVSSIRSRVAELLAY